mgnify:CR=1 FL=1
MRITPELDGARVTVARAAELAGMHPAYFRRLCRRGVFPKPKRTPKGRPYYDYRMLVTIARVIKTGIGLNREEIMFRQRPAHHNKTPSRKASQPDPLITELIAAFRKLGAPEKEIKPKALKARLRVTFGSERPSFDTAFQELLSQLFPLQ